MTLSFTVSRDSMRALKMLIHSSLSQSKATSTVADTKDGEETDSHDGSNELFNAPPKVAKAKPSSARKAKALPPP